MEIFFYVAFLIPLGWIILFEQEKLHIKKVYLKFLTVSVLLVIVGIVFFYNKNSKAQSAGYFGSQIMLTFLISQKLLSIPYKKIFKREPIFIGYLGKISDFIYSIIIFTAIITLPLLIDVFIIQKNLE